MAYKKYSLWLIIACLAVAGCESEKTLDRKLSRLISEHGLDGNFQPDISVQSQPLAELGGLLFFSPDLSINGAVSCASCHHPDKGGADGLPLPVGVVGVDAGHIGQARLEAARSANPAVPVHGLIPRNSPTVINAALYRQTLFWDGRIHYREVPGKPGERTIQAGVFGPGQSNPSNYLQQNLLQTQARMPMSSTFEMKGGLRPNSNNHEIEQDILHFLQSQARWCSEFAKVFGDKPCNELITLNHLTQALAEFQASLILTDSPFERYIRGDRKALDKQQKKGAIAFLTAKENGGAGCIACHSGKTFSSERFYNINIPPSGRGANESGWDLGHNNVDKSAARFSFRVPNLLNIAETAPYFHNGIALTLEDAIRHKQTAGDADKPAYIIEMDDIDYAAVKASIQQGFDNGPAKALLPERLDDNEISRLAAFLRSLTDDCLLDKKCTASLTREVIESRRQKTAQRTAGPENLRSMQAAAKPELNCRRQPPANKEPGLFYFTRHGQDLGLTHERRIGLIKKGWLIDVVNYASVSAVDLNNNCLDDLVFDAGGTFVWYQQQADGHFKRHAVDYQPQPGAVSPLVMDLDGDYRQDLFVGNYGQGSAVFVFDFLNRSDDVVEMRALTGPVINASAGDINNDGHQDVVFAMWRSFHSLKQPHVWLNDGAGNLTADNGYIALRQHERMMGGNEKVKRVTPQSAGSSDLTFTPNLVDIDDDGDQDLLLAADFFRSQVLENRNGRLVDITNKAVINDSNGMGAAIADFNGDGLPDWFVTSIVDKRIPMIDGHKLYMNQGGGAFSREPVVNKAEEWSWGACAGDFNNDGHLDIFYISGYAEAMKSASYQSADQKEATDKFLQNLRMFSGAMPTLLINDGEGNFTDRSQEFGLTESFDGRGVACFDYQQDGDLDIVATALEGPPVLYRNHLDGARNWLAVRLQGPPGNSEAFGSKVTLYSGDKRQHRQLRFENNFASRNPAQLHFGLGDRQAVDKLVIELPPPLNKTVVIENPAINRLHVYDIESLLER